MQNTQKNLQTSYLHQVSNLANINKILVSSKFMTFKVKKKKKNSKLHLAKAEKKH